MNDCHKRGSVNFLTNALGELNDNIEVPEELYTWYSNFFNDFNSHVYFVNLDNQYGVMVINEFDTITAENIYNGDLELMRNAVLKNASLLCSNEVVGKHSIYVSENTGCGKSDEITVFVPATTETAIVRTIISVIDSEVYKN